VQFLVPRAGHPPFRGGSSTRAGEPITIGMRSATGLCIGFGTIAGGYAPALWGASGFSLVSILTGALGGIAGLWLGLRLQS